MFKVNLPDYVTIIFIVGATTIMVIVGPVHLETIISTCM